MKSVYAGYSVALNYTLAASTYVAKFQDADGAYLSASVSQSGGTATVNVAAAQWNNGKAGMGHLQIADTSSDPVVVVDEKIRILKGLDVGVSDYGV